MGAGGELGTLSFLSCRMCVHTETGVVLQGAVRGSGHGASLYDNGEKVLCEISSLILIPRALGRIIPRIPSISRPKFWAGIKCPVAAFAIAAAGLFRCNAYGTVASRSAVLAAVAALVEILFVNPSARSPCTASSAVEMTGRPGRQGAATALHSARTP